MADIRHRKKINLTVDTQVLAETRKHTGPRKLSHLTEQLWRSYNTAVDKEKACNSTPQVENPAP